MKLKRLIVLVFLLSLWTTVYSAGEIKEEEQAELLCDWSKIVIQDGKAITIIPYRVGENRMKEYTSVKLPMLTIDLNKFSRKNLLYTQQIINQDVYGLLVTMYPHVYREDNKCLPFAWDLNSEVYTYMNYDGPGGGQGMTFVITSNKYIENNENGYYKKFSRYYFFNKVHKSSEKYYYTGEDGKEYLDYKYTYHDPIEGIYHRVLCCKDNSTLFFMLNRNNVFVWKAKQSIKPDESEKIEDVWSFQYAFKLPITKPFDVCQSEDTLYVMNKTTGTYKVDIQKAIDNSPEIKPPDFSGGGWGRCKLYFPEIVDEKLSENIVKAEKISDLKYDYYIDDKDNETGYIAVDNYMYKLSDLTKRTKIPEAKKKDTYVEYQVDRIYTALEAYLAFRTRYEKTPANLLKVTPDVEVIDKPASNSNAANPEAADGSEDNSNDRKTKKELENDSGSQNDNSNQEADDVDSESIDNSDLKSDDETDGSNDNESDSNKNRRRTDRESDGSNIVFYAGGGFVLIILIIMVLVLMPRKKN